MDINLEALLKQAGYTLAEIITGLAKAKTSEDVNWAISTLWKTPKFWREKGSLSINDIATLSEADWKVICRAAKARCEELGGDFKDPTGTWSF